MALRRLTTAAFGTLMALEPALALLIGFLCSTRFRGSWRSCACSPRADQLGSPLLMVTVRLVIDVLCSGRCGCFLL